MQSLIKCRKNLVAAKNAEDKLYPAKSFIVQGQLHQLVEGILWQLCGLMYIFQKLPPECMKSALNAAQGTLPPQCQPAHVCVEKESRPLQAVQSCSDTTSDMTKSFR